MHNMELKNKYCIGKIGLLAENLVFIYIGFCVTCKFYVMFIFKWVEIRSQLKWKMFIDVL